MSKYMTIAVYKLVQELTELKSSRSLYYPERILKYQVIKLDFAVSPIG